MGENSRELLQRYVNARCEDSFALLVQEFLPLVYSAAFRRLDGDKHLAEDVAQSVFSNLAQKAGSLPADISLAGWLYRDASFKAAALVRRNQRRRAREKNSIDSPVADFIDPNDKRADLFAAIESAMDRLPETDRDVVVLRFFQKQNFNALAAIIGTTEDTAQKRVQRALERLRTLLQCEGITCNASMIIDVFLSEPLVETTSISAAAVASHATATAPAIGSAATTTLIMSSKLKTAFVVAVALGLGAGFEYQRLTANRLREINAQLAVAAQAARAPVTEPSPVTDESELARLRAEHLELMRLRAEVARLSKESSDLHRQIPKPKTAARAAITETDVQWVQQILQSTPDIQGRAAGALRGKLLRGEASEVTGGEVQLRESLLKINLTEKLESSPADFASFQAAYIESAVGLDDPVKVTEIRDLIRNTYEKAVADGLVINSKPAENTEDWVQRRHQLDRLATTAIQQKLTEEQRALFDRAFLGVMGVDLGGVGVDRSNYPPGFLGPEAK